MFTTFDCLSVQLQKVNTTNSSNLPNMMSLWYLRQVNQKSLGVRPSLSNQAKIFLKILPMTLLISWPSFQIK